MFSYPPEGEKASTLQRSETLDVELEIQEAYRLVLERHPDAEGQATLKKDLNDGSITIADVYKRLLRSEEYETRNRELWRKFARAFADPDSGQSLIRSHVRTTYRLLLDREPDEGAYTYESELLKGKSNLVDFFYGIIDSPEYLQKKNLKAVHAGYVDDVTKVAFELFDGARGLPCKVTLEDVDEAAKINIRDNFEALILEYVDTIEKSEIQLTES